MDYSVENWVENEKVYLSQLIILYPQWALQVAGDNVCTQNGGDNAAGIPWAWWEGWLYSCLDLKHSPPEVIRLFEMMRTLFKPDTAETNWNHLQAHIYLAVDGSMLVLRCANVVDIKQAFNQALAMIYLHIYMFLVLLSRENIFWE